jgi:hypothetical protein
VWLPLPLLAWPIWRLPFKETTSPKPVSVLTRSVEPAVVMNCGEPVSESATSSATTRPPASRFTVPASQTRSVRPTSSTPLLDTVTVPVPPAADAEPPTYKFPLFVHVELVPSRPLPSTVTTPVEWSPDPM